MALCSLFEVLSNRALSQANIITSLQIEDDNTAGCGTSREAEFVASSHRKMGQRSDRIHARSSPALQSRHPTRSQAWTSDWPPLYFIIIKARTPIYINPGPRIGL